MKATANIKKFGFKDQLCYMFGDAGGSFVNVYVDTYILVFCTDVLKINSMFMAGLFLAARLWDAINDPLIGSLPDRHMLGKSGDRFKPYIKLFMIPLALSGVMCFSDVHALPGVWKYVWISAAYIFYGMCYTGTSMPYGAMATVISADPVENTKLSRIRSVGAAAVSGLLTIAAPIFVFKNNVAVPSAFFAISLIFGVCCILCYIILLRGSTERVHYEIKENEYKFREVLKNAVHNRPLIGTMLGGMGYLFYSTGFLQTSSYLFKDYYKDTSFLSFVGVLSAPFMVVLFFILPSLVKKHGKVKVVLIPTLFSTLTAAFAFIVPIKNPWIFLVLYALSIIGPTAYTLTCWSLVTDCIEYHEYKFGQRANSSVYSIYTFARKIGSTLASTLASFGLGITGYVSGAQEQTEQVASNIRYLVTAIPLVGCLLILVGLGAVYNVKKAETDRIHASLEARRTEVNAD